MNSYSMPKEKRIEEIIKHFSIFVLPEDYQHLPGEILKFLLEQAFVLTDINELSIDEVRQVIKVKFGLDFETEEIKNILETSEEFISIFSGRYKLESNKFMEIKEANEKNMKNENEVYERWKNRLKEKYPLITDETLDILVSDLKIFFTKILLKHGAECARIFYFTKDIDLTLSYEDIFLHLPSRKREIEEIRRIEFINFFTESELDLERQKLIFDQLNASFIYRIISIEPSCSKYIKSTHFIEDEIFLDCNLLFSLLGLNSEARRDLARKVLEIAKKFGFKVYVTEKTKEEYLYSLGRYEASLRRVKMPSTKILSAAEGYIGENPVNAYWREYARSRIGIDEFFNLYKRINNQLSGYGIQVMKKGADSIEVPILEKEIKRMESLIPNKAPFPKIVEHDSFCILYIRERKFQLYTPKYKRAFFLTEDRDLLSYEYKINRFRPEDSVCIMPYQLLQILRPLLPRTKDFEKAFINAITQPILRSQNLLPTNIAIVILNRLSLYKNQPSKIVPKLLADSYFTNKIRYLMKRELSEKVDELIDKEALVKAGRVIEEQERQLKEEKIGKEKLLFELEELRKFRKEVETQQKKRPKDRWVKFMIGFLVIIFLNYIVVKNIEAFISWVDKYAKREIFWTAYLIGNLFIFALLIYLSFGKQAYLEVKSWFTRK